MANTGTAWYYVLVQSNEAFYLPQTDGFFQFGGEGDFVGAGLPDITGDLGSLLGANPNGVGLKTGAFKQTKLSSSDNVRGTNSACGSNNVHFYASDSNPIYGNNDSVQPNAVQGYLYFYVGETIQNANLVNVARIEEKLVDLIPDNSKLWDGQWISANQISLIGSTNLTDTPVVMDLSDILPKDGYKYLLSLSMTVNGTNKAASNVYGESSDLTSSSVRFTMRDIGTGVQLGSTGYAIVGTDRKLYARTTSSTNTTAIVLLGYKRLGTNI